MTYLAFSIYYSDWILRLNAGVFAKQTLNDLFLPTVSTD